MSDISSINTGSLGKEAVSTTEVLKKETIKKLEALGIDPSSVSSEAEARTKIKEAESAQSQADLKVLQGNEANPMQQIFSDAKELGEKIGVKVGSVDDIKDILNNLDAKIGDFEKAVENDPEKRAIAESLREQFGEITTTYNNAQISEAKITGEMGVKADFNKQYSRVNTSEVTRQQILELELAQSKQAKNFKKPENVEEIENPVQETEVQAKQPQNPFVVVNEQKTTDKNDKDKEVQKNQPKHVEKEPDGKVEDGFKKNTFGILAQPPKVEEKKEIPADKPKEKVDAVNVNEKKSDSIFINGIANTQTSEKVRETKEETVQKQNLETVKSLAARVGVSADGITDISSIYSRINDKINNMEQSGDTLANVYRQEYNDAYKKFLNSQ